MKLLLDTHILIWALAGEGRLLHDSVRKLIEDEGNELFFSAVSVWEVAVKNAIRPGQTGVTTEQLIRLCAKAGIHELPMASRHALAVETLSRPEDAPPHKDPFDRMLIA